MQMINKKINKKPTTEEFNKFIPIRLDFNWSINKKGFVVIEF